MKRIMAASILMILASAALGQNPTPSRGSQTDQVPENREITRVRLGGKVMADLLVHKVQPNYPSEARKERVTGTVRLHVIVGKDGKVEQLDVLAGPVLLQQPAMEAVRQWRYRPTLLKGHAVEVETVVEVIYSLKN